jgi:hypothetical protein
MMLFAAVHESVVGPSRQFTSTHPFGPNRRQSGHAAKPCAASGRRELTLSRHRPAVFVVMHNGVFVPLMW